MSRLNRNQLKKLILKEFKMMGMGNMGALGDAPLGMGSRDHGHGSEHGMEEDFLGAPDHDYGSHSSGSVSKEDCCKAVLCLIECCDCPKTKAKIRQCCEDILASC